MIERRFPGLRPLAAAILALTAVAGAPSARAAGFPAAYVVADVPVDATAQSAVQAREAARTEGERKAFRQLLERLTAKSDWTRLPQPGDDQIANLLQDFEVKDEHSSAVRYLASYTYRFSPNGVRRLLRDAHIPVTELASKPVIIVPVLNGSGGAKLWDDPNPWRQAWAAADGKAGLVPWTLPAGDLADVTALDAPAAGKPTPDQLQALSHNYDGGDVVIASANPSGDGLQVTVARYTPDGSADPVTVQASGQPPAVYAAAVQATEQALEDKWKQLTVASGPGGDQDQVIAVSVPITGAADWGAVRDRLTRIPFIHGEQVDLFGRTEVRLRLRLRGNPELLRIGFAQQDLVFTPGQPMATLALRTPIAGAKAAAAPAAPTAPTPPADGEQD